MNSRLLKTFRECLGICLSLWACEGTRSDEVTAGLAGDWSPNVASGMPPWMRVLENDGVLLVHMRLYIGGTGPYKATQEAVD